MGSLDLLNHCFNFLAPALAAGFFVAILAPIGFKKTLALACGLWFFGNDGKMATYAAMVMLVASCQWVGVKAWR